MSALFPRGGHQIRLAILLICITSAHSLIEWVVKPENTSLLLGQDVVFSCLAKSADASETSASLAYRWSFDGGKVQDRVSRFSNYSLFVPGLTEADLGVYTCEVSRVTVNGNVLESVSASALLIKSYLEPFIIQPSSVFASLGDSVVLTCVTGKSSPRIKVKWLRNGGEFQKGFQQIASFGDYDPSGLTVQWSMKLTLDISEDVFGAYSCQATNEMLSVSVFSKEANVTYIDIPSVGNTSVLDWSLPSSLIIKEDSSFIMPCRTKPSKEIPIITWYRENSILNATSRVYVLTNRSLAFFPYLASDNGNYSCAVSNSAGVFVSPSISLTAAYLSLAFRKQPSDTNSFLGDNVTLSCDPPDSVPAAEVIWYKDYSPLNLTSNRIRLLGHDLYLYSAKLIDRGIYYCVAINNWSSPSIRTSATAQLTVKGPPIIMDPPLSIKIVRGKPLQLTCRVDGEPFPTTTWLFQGRNLTQTGKVTLVEQGQVLWINDMGKEWEGQFTCVTSNQFGTITAEALVTVIVAPVSLSSIGDIVSKVGDSLRIPCYVVSDPQPTVVWFLNGSSVSQPSTTSDTSLHIDYVTTKHAGMYTCLGYNEAGNATSSGSLTVNVIPSVSVPLKNVSVVIGQYITFTCEFDGQPSPFIFWLFNSSLPVPSNARLGQTNSSLTIGPVSWDNQGVYTCVGENIVGRALSNSYLNVQVPPQVTTITFPQGLVRQHSRFVLSCTASGIPTPTIQWIFQKQPIKSSANGRVQAMEMGVVIVEFALKNDTGAYDCWASSSAGEDHKIATVTVYGGPTPPSLSSVSPRTFDSVSVQWNWSNQGDMTNRVDQFQISYREKLNEVIVVFPTLYSANDSQGFVLGLKPYTMYVFTITALNDAGVSDSSNPLTVTTNQSYPSTPSSVLVSNVTSVTATLRWEPPSEPNGIVRMYQMRYKKARENSDYVFVNITASQIPSIEILISPLLPYTQYIVQVQAANTENRKELWGNFSTPVTFQTLPSLPAKSPQNVQGFAADPYSIKVLWQVDYVQDLNGPILYYYIICRNNESKLNTTLKVDSSVTEALISGLHPWRMYSVQVYGVNEAGAGPMSLAISIWTLAIAPIASLTSFTVIDYLATGFKLQWKPVEISLQTCNITGYNLQFRVQGKTDWVEHWIPSYNVTMFSGFFETLLDSLNPWTLYEIRLAAYCDNVSPGLGPFTYPLLSKTLQGISGPVKNANYSASSDSIWLSWQPPAEPKGEVTSYDVVLYQATSTENTKAQVKFQTVATSLVLTSLSPETNYSISLQAMNSAGRGEAIHILVTTSALIVSTLSSDVTEVSTEYLTHMTYEVSNVTGFFQAQQSDLPIKQNLAAIVAGSIVGTIAFVIVTVFICIKCIKYRRKQRLNYVVEEAENEEPVSTYRPLEPPVQSSFTPSFHFTDNTEAKSAPITSSQSVPVITLTQPSALNENSVSSSTNSSHGFQEKPKQKSHLLPKISISFAYSKLDDDQTGAEANVSEGYENPGFAFAITKEKTSTSFLSIPGLADSYSDMASCSSETLRRNHRMRSEVAAAIAFMRIHKGEPLDETDILIEKEIEAEVIFSERTMV
ncbi:hemicentin-2 [Biomphalaria pfeifferi]|uniref:Hemicentin-2 n=1 Tax=Biomphalaria pfeifferi TaxID=112525 RepID=A0AAD8C5K7_BIOPF|nr:hemicentin-2 [Biomphalaria pfeifferi]